MNELQKRLAKLPNDAPLSEVFRVISEWEDWAVKRHWRIEREVIRHGLSGRIYPICPFTDSLTKDGVNEK